MKKTTIIGICLLLVSMALTSAVTLKIGTTDKEIDKDVADSIIAKAELNEQTLDEYVSDRFITLENEEYFDELNQIAERKFYQIIEIGDMDKTKSLIAYMDSMMITEKEEISK